MSQVVGKGSPKASSATYLLLAYSATLFSLVMLLLTTSTLILKTYIYTIILISLSKYCLFGIENTCLKSYIMNVDQIQ